MAYIQINNRKRLFVRLSAKIAFFIRKFYSKYCHENRLLIDIVNCHSYVQSVRGIATYPFIWRLIQPRITYVYFKIPPEIGTLY